MRYEILLAPEAVQDFESLKANVRAAVRDAIDQHLRHQPTKVSKSRIKRLRGLSHPKSCIYAAAGIADYWILNLLQQVVRPRTRPAATSARFPDPQA